MSLAKLFNKQNEGWFTKKDKLTTTGIAGLTGIGGSVVTGLLANGNKSKAGEVMGKLGDAAGMIPGPIGAVASATLKTIGGLTNAAFGSNLNQQMINNIQNSANKVANTRYNASTVAGLLGEARKNSGFAGFSKKQLGTQGWWSNARDNAYNRLTALGKAAVSARDLNLTNAAQAIDTTMTNNAKRNITAFGGPLNLSGPMEYEIANQQMSNYNIRTNAQAGNLLDNMYAGLYAFGGNIDANGANFSTGLKHVNAGGTHEESPYEGVPMGTDSEGTPNLVEENEVIYNDYVFSDRLKVPVIKVKKGQELQQFEKILRKYKGLSYAAAAKKAEVNSGVDERPNDNIARRGFEFELDVLAQSQELERAIDHAETPEEKEQLRQLTPEQFAQIQAEQQAQEQAMQEQMMQQQAMQQQQQQMSPEEAAMQEQMAQMSPEEQAMMQQQMAAQQQGMSPEEAAMMQAQGYAEGGELGVPTDDQDVTGQAAQMEEAPHEQTTMFNAGTPAEEMSTSMLNETIDEIYQYAKEHKNRELLKDARKAKRGSREDKEEFVDDAREDIMMSIEEQEQLAQQQAEQEQALQEQQAVQMSQQETAEETVQADAGQELDAQMEPQVFAYGGQLNDDQMNQLDAFMETLKVQDSKEVQAIYSQYDQLKQQGKINEALQLAMQVYQAAAKQQNSYALGGSMDLNNPDGGNIVAEDKIYAGENTSKDEEELLKYLVKKGLKKKWLEGEGKRYFQEELQRYSTAKKDNSEVTLDDSNLLINRYKGDNIQKRKGRQAFTNAVTTELYPVLDKQGKSITYTAEGKVPANYTNIPTQLKSENYSKYQGKFATPDKWDFSKFIYPTKQEQGNGKYYKESDFSKYTRAGTGNNPYRFEPQLVETGYTGEEYENLPAYRTSRLAFIKALKERNPQAIDRFKTMSAVSASRLPKGNKEKPRYNPYLVGVDGSDIEALNYNAMGDFDKELYDIQFNTPDALDKLDDLVKRYRQARNTKGYQIGKNLLMDAMFDGEVAQNHAIEPKERHVAAFSNSDGTIDRSRIVPSININDHNTYAGYTLGENPLDSTTSPDGTVTYFYPITGGNLNTNILKTNSFGDFTVDNTEGLEELNDDKLPQYEDLAEGYTGKVNYFNLKKPDTKDPGIPYPMPDKTPLLADLAMQTGNYLNTALSNPDYSRAEALIQGGKELQDFTPVKAEMLGNYLKYTPFDFNYVNTQARNANQAGLSTIRNMTNGNIGQQLANTLTSNYNYTLGIGNNYVQGFQYNDKNKERDATFNSGIAKYNSQADLEAQKANQSASLQSGAAGLEFMGKGYAMMDEIDKNRSAALSAGLTGMSRSLNNYYNQDFANRQAAWRLHNQPRGNMTQFTDADGVTWVLNANGDGYSKKKSLGGKLKNRRIIKNILID